MADPRRCPYCGQQFKTGRTFLEHILAEVKAGWVSQEYLDLEPKEGTFDEPA